MTTLIPILGDQLSHSLSSLGGADPATSVLLMMEVAEEATYVRHHKRKIAYIFSAMRHRAKALQAAGWRVGGLIMSGLMILTIVAALRVKWRARLHVMRRAKLSLRTAANGGCRPQ